jgi:hypothetical protein
MTLGEAEEKYLKSNGLVCSFCGGNKIRPEYQDHTEDGDATFDEICRKCDAIYKTTYVLKEVVVEGYPTPEE